jgi:FKBP-type peptidyl-prolyl cis-trans isomerase
MLMNYKLLSTYILLTTLNGCMGVETVEKRPEGPKSVTLNSGLRYIILQEAPEGSPIAQEGKLITVHYTGWLNQNDELGQKFDSSVDRNQPFKFVLGIGQVIQGWDKGVVGMKVGEKRRLFIPAQLAYGNRGAGNIIKPNAALIFDVELLAA